MRASWSMVLAALTALPLSSCPLRDFGQRSEPVAVAPSPVRVRTPPAAHPAPAPVVDAPAEPAEARPILAALAPETFVFERPSSSAHRLGYLRAGAVVTRDAEPASRAQCAQGWYRIAPEGYVCVGKVATLDAGDPVVVAAGPRPDRMAGLPYTYGRSQFPPPTFHTRLPADGHPAPAWDGVRFEPVPDFLQGGRPLPTVAGYAHSGQAVPDSAFAFIRFFEADGKRFGLTADLALLSLDRLSPVRPSEFCGLPLDDSVTLPVVFVMTHEALAYRREGEGLRFERRLRYREAVPITGARAKIGAADYLETTSGLWLRDANLVRVDRLRSRPGWATVGRTWVDVSILTQTLVAYVGTRPVYVTLVSTGADGLGDPEKTHSTVRGEFLIHTKHVTATMSDEAEHDAFDLRDVPYVQYFTEGYALHAAYWHDGFGSPRSHGCVNLSPRDARWLFHWTDPPVPQGWHGALSRRDGTLVSVHP